MDFQQFVSMFKGSEPHIFHVQCVSPRRYTEFFSLRPKLSIEDVGPEDCPEEKQVQVLQFSSFDDSCEVYIGEGDIEQVTVIHDGASFIFVQANGSIVYVSAYSVSQIPVRHYFAVGGQ